MTKKTNKTTKTAKAIVEQLPIVLPPLDAQIVDLKVSMNTDDVVTIASTRAETFIQKNIATCRAFSKECEQSIRTLDDAINGEAKRIAEAFNALNTDALEAGLEVLGFKPVIAVEDIMPPNAFDTKYPRDDISSTPKLCGSGIGVNATIVVRNDDRSRNHLASFEIKLCCSPDLRTMLQNRDTERVRLADSLSEQLSWRRKLANMHVFERQMRAQIAESNLQRSEEGRAVLELLLGDVEQRVLALPSC
jgi:hypothetical protein